MQIPATPTDLQSFSVLAGTGLQMRADKLLGHQQPTQASLDELAALEQAPPLASEELARQALDAGGIDGDSSTPD